MDKNPTINTTTIKFDSLSEGTHFQRATGEKFIKVVHVTRWLGRHSVFFQCDMGNKNKFDAIKYDGTPTTIPADEMVTFLSTPNDIELDELTVLKKENNLLLKFLDKVADECQCQCRNDYLCPPCFLSKFRKKQCSSNVSSLSELTDVLVDNNVDKLLDTTVKVTSDKPEKTVLNEGVKKRCSTLLCGKDAEWVIKLPYQELLKCSMCYERGNWNDGIRIPKLTFDKIEKSDKVEESKLKNKQTEPTYKTMKTYNTLKDAVIAAIEALKQSGTMSVFQITTYIREQTNKSEWDIPSVAAKPNGQGIRCWINRNDVRQILEDMFNQDELTAIGFVNRSYNGQYVEYDFSGVVGQSTIGAPAASQMNTTQPTTKVADRLVSFVSQYGSTNPTFKRVQSALKMKGVTCEQLKDIAVTLNLTVIPGQNVGCFSEYIVKQ